MKKNIQTILISAALLFSGNALANTDGDKFFYTCVDQKSNLTAENGRFYCACQTANFIQHEQEAALGEEFDLNAVKQSCQSVITAQY